MRDRIAVLCPSRSRPEGLQALADSIAGTSEKADLLAYIDDDQIATYAKAAATKGVRHTMLGPRLGPVASANALVERFPDYAAYGLVTDDATLTMPGWDEYLLDVIAACPKRIVVVSPRHNQGEHVDMPFVSREWIDVVGWFAYPKAFHYVWPIITGLIGEQTAIVHAPEQFFSVDHPPAPQVGNLDRKAGDAEAFFTFVSTELPAVVERVREELSK